MAAPDLRSVIEHLTTQWLSSPTDVELVEVVRTSGALPVYAGMGATLLLRPDGEILCFPCDSPGAPVPESDPVWRLIAVVVVAETYPELRPLLPVRPFETPDCQPCAGTGRFRIGESDRRSGVICGECNGLGWRNTAG